MSRGINILCSASPFPIAYDGACRAGYQHHVPSVCQNCADRTCLKADGGRLKHRTCQHGMSNYQFEFLGCRAAIIGLISTDKNNTVGGDRRKALKANWVTDHEVMKFLDTVKNIEVAANEFGVEQTQAGLASFHEIRSCVGVVQRVCERFIREVPGQDLSEKFENADPNVRSLFQAISLLKEQLELTDVIANPDSITYGPRFESDLNGFFFKMARLYENTANKRGIKIQFHGGGDCRVGAYNSFQRVPMVLLDNAIKYSYANRSIYINIASNKQSTTVRISSFGDIVPNEFRERIFEKFFRGPRATAQSAEGMGLGLYVARQIANAHGFRLHYEAKSVDDIDVGNNDFVLTIPREL